VLSVHVVLIGLLEGKKAWEVVRELGVERLKFHGSGSWCRLDREVSVRIADGLRCHKARKGVSRLTDRWWATLHENHEKMCEICGNANPAAATLPARSLRYEGCVQSFSGVRDTLGEAAENART